MSIGKYTILGKEIFSVGTWNGDPYSPDDLKEIVKAFKETEKKYRPYLKLGHTEDQAMLQKEGLPAAGWVENLRIEGDKLVCDFMDIPDKVYKLITENAYRYVSSEIFWDIEFEGKKYKKMLAGVALLGAEMPAVTNLNDFVNLYKLDAKLIKTYTVKNGVNMNEEEKKKADEEAAAKKKLADDEAAKKLADEEAKKKLSEQVPAVTPEQLMEKIKELESKIAAITQKLGAANDEAAKYKMDAESASIEKFLAENKVIPAAKEYVKAILGADKKEYSVSDKKYSKEQMLKEVLKIYSVTQVNLDENSRAGEEKPQAGKEQKLIDDIKKYASENKVSFTDAYKKLSADKSVQADDEE